MCIYYDVCYLSIIVACCVWCVLNYSYVWMVISVSMFARMISLKWLVFVIIHNDFILIIYYLLVCIIMHCSFYMFACLYVYNVLVLSLVCLINYTIFSDLPCRYPTTLWHSGYQVVDCTLYNPWTPAAVYRIVQYNDPSNNCSQVQMLGGNSIRLWHLSKTVVLHLCVCPS